MECSHDCGCRVHGSRLPWLHLGLPAVLPEYTAQGKIGSGSQKCLFLVLTQVKFLANHCEITQIRDLGRNLDFSIARTDFPWLFQTYPHNS